MQTGALQFLTHFAPSREVKARLDKRYNLYSFFNSSAFSYSFLLPHNRLKSCMEDGISEDGVSGNIPVFSNGTQKI